MINEADLSRQFCEKHPAEAAAVLTRLPAETAAAFLSGLAPLRAAGLLQHILPAQAAAILLHFSGEHTAAVLYRLNLTEAAGLLRPLNREQRAALLAALPADLTARLTRLVGFPAGTVGSLLATAPLTLLDDWSVKHSLREFKRIAATTVCDLPVVDSHQRLGGTVSLHRLLRERDDLRVGTLIDNTLPALPADAALTSVAQHPLWDRSTAAPVVDLNDRLLGVLHHAKLREYLTGHQGPQGFKTLTPMMALAEVYWTASSALVAILGERFNSSRK